MLTDIEPRVKARVEQLIAEVGDEEFRRGVAEMTGFDTAALGLDDLLIIDTADALARWFLLSTIFTE